MPTTTAPVVPINRQHVPALLRTFRTRHGLSQQDLVDHLAALAWQHTGEHLGLDRQMISKWERGLKLPGPRYRRLLALLLATGQLPTAPSGRTPSWVCHNSRLYPHRFPVTGGAR
jgi:transcriptional regulator with XRE-family HTH domain